MSVRQINMAWACEAVSDGPELLVLLALANFANDEGVCWPSMAELGSRARMSERSARRYIRRLEEKGLLECPSTKGGKGRSNRYRLVLNTRTSVSEFEDDKGGHQRPGNTPSNPDTHNRPSVSGFAQTQTPVSGFETQRRTPEVTKADTAMSEEPSRTVNKGGGRVYAGAHAREAADLRLRLYQAAGIDTSRDASGSLFASDSLWLVEGWRTLGLTDDEMVAEVASRAKGKADGPARSLKWFDQPIRRLAGLKRAPPPEPIAPSPATNGAHHDRPRSAITPGEASVIRRRQLRQAIAASVEAEFEQPGHGADFDAEGSDGDARDDRRPARRGN